MPNRPATVEWSGSAVGGCVKILDQRLLPVRTKVLRLTTLSQVYEAIQTLAVRGAPAIGVAAGYGMVIAARDLPCDPARAGAELARRGEYLKSSRPTAVNLEWAVHRMLAAATGAIENRKSKIENLPAALLVEARAIHIEDLAMCAAIGRHGLAFIKRGIGVLTHCNAGSLATSDFGTALAPLYEAHRRGISFRVFADETRPLLQGARLTAWELSRAGIDVTVICDNMAALVMREKKVQLVIVGADRIAANGDTANKIGTYSVATLAQAHGIPFLVAAPSSTFDLALPEGSGIPIEERNAREITHGFGRQTAPHGVATYNPAFDVTPACLIHAIITERGIISPVNAATIGKALRAKA